MPWSLRVGSVAASALAIAAVPTRATATSSDLGHPHYATVSLRRRSLSPTPMRSRLAHCRSIHRPVLFSTRWPGPGFFHSRLADVAIPLAEPGIKEFSPLGRAGAPGELKGVAVFPAADASNYITGQTIVVDGGGTIS